MGYPAYSSPPIAKPSAAQIEEAEIKAKIEADQVQAEAAAKAADLAAANTGGE